MMRITDRSSPRTAVIAVIVVSMLAWLGYLRTTTMTPTLSLALFLVFLASIQATLFYCYNLTVQERIRTLSEEKKRLERVVNEIYPSCVREQVKDATRQEPVLHFYPSATVIFADIAGFTAWCATCTPIEVLQLLQRLYADMDRLATKHHVFKVETIGDCYLAVTGAPVEDPDHAVHMVHFAEQMVTRATEIFQSKESTSCLQMRVGIHSGPIAAGVLAGTKCRYQIFGDTVNTGSRMESLSKPGRIQVSRATKELLKAGGQDHLLQRRRDAVYAKGKGELITYWLQRSDVEGSVPELHDFEDKSLGDILPKLRNLERVVSGKAPMIPNLRQSGVRHLRDFENAVTRKAPTAPPRSSYSQRSALMLPATATRRNLRLSSSRSRSEGTF